MGSNRIIVDRHDVIATFRYDAFHQCDHDGSCVVRKSNVCEHRNCERWFDGAVLGLLNCTLVFLDVFALVFGAGRGWRVWPTEAPAVSFSTRILGWFAWEIGAKEYQGNLARS